MGAQQHLGANGEDEPNASRRLMGRDSAISARISPGNRRAAVDRRVAAPGFGTLKAHMGEARARRLVVLPLPIGSAIGSGASETASDAQGFRHAKPTDYSALLRRCCKEWSCPPIVEHERVGSIGKKIATTSAAGRPVFAAASAWLLGRFVRRSLGRGSLHPPS